MTKCFPRGFTRSGHPFSHGLRSHPKFVAEVHERYTFIADRYKNGSSRISHLPLLCSPAYISRFVISVVVDSVNRVLRGGAVANIIKKPLKGNQPFIADVYASPAVTPVLSAGGAQTATFYVRPCLVFRGTPIVGCRSMYLVAALTLFASAGGSFSVFQSGSHSNMLVATGAPTPVVSDAAAFPNEPYVFEQRKSAERHPLHVCTAGHNGASEQGNTV